jgi:threonine dehydratase
VNRFSIRAIVYLSLCCVFSSQGFCYETSDRQENFSKEKFIEASAILQTYLEETPLVYLPTLSKTVGKQVYLKDESRQKGASFKIRGVTYEVFHTIHTEGNLPNY